MFVTEVSLRFQLRERKEWNGYLTKKLTVKSVETKLLAILHRSHILKFLCERQSSRRVGVSSPYQHVNPQTNVCKQSWAHYPDLYLTMFVSIPAVNQGGGAEVHTTWKCHQLVWWQRIRTEGWCNEGENSAFIAPARLIPLLSISFERGSLVCRRPRKTNSLRIFLDQEKRARAQLLRVPFIKLRFLITWAVPPMVSEIGVCLNKARVLRRDDAFCGEMTRAVAML